METEFGTLEVLYHGDAILVHTRGREYAYVNGVPFSSLRYDASRGEKPRYGDEALSGERWQEPDEVGPFTTTHVTLYRADGKDYSSAAWSKVKNTLRKLVNELARDNPDLVAKGAVVSARRSVQLQQHEVDRKKEELHKAETELFARQTKLNAAIREAELPAAWRNTKEDDNERV